MPTPRRGAWAVVALALFVAPALSGCGTGQTAPASAGPHIWLVGGLVEQLKREDDETELKEIREHESTREDREQAHERAEQEEVEAADAQAQPEG